MCICVYRIDLLVGNSKPSESIDFNGELVGLGGLEPPTSPLSGVRSNQLSYRPEEKHYMVFDRI